IRAICLVAASIVANWCGQSSICLRDEFDVDDREGLVEIAIQIKLLAVDLRATPLEHQGQQLIGVLALGSDLLALPVDPLLHPLDGTASRLLLQPVGRILLGLAEASLVALFLVQPDVVAVSVDPYRLCRSRYHPRFGECSEECILMRAR